MAKAKYKECAVCGWKELSQEVRASNWSQEQGWGSVCADCNDNSIDVDPDYISPSFGLVNTLTTHISNRQKT